MTYYPGAEDEFLSAFLEFKRRAGMLADLKSQGEPEHYEVGSANRAYMVKKLAGAERALEDSRRAFFAAFRNLKHKG